MTDDPGLDPLLPSQGGDGPAERDVVDVDARTDESADAPASPDAAVYRRRRLTALALGLVVLVTVATAVTALLGGSDDEPTTSGAFRLEAWAPYWAFDRSIGDLADNGDLLEEVSPFVYVVTGPTEVELDPSADPAQVARFIQSAREEGLAVVPSVLDQTSAGAMASVLGSENARRQHIAALVRLAADEGYDGLDIDYEQFAFADGRSTWGTTRVSFGIFITELAAALHADGRTLTVSIPPVYDEGQTDSSGYWVYDYETIALAADRIRVMAYDYSGQGAGPISPIDWVRKSIAGAVQAAGSPDKIVLGIPLYGNNVPVDTVGDCPEGEIIGRTAVTIGSVDELIERRDGVPEFDAATGEWSFRYELELASGDTTCTQIRQVNYVDSAGARARLDLAIEADLAGASLWALGYEDDSLWQAIRPVLVPADS